MKGRIDWFEIVIGSLANNEPDDPDTLVWSDGDELLCRTKEKADEIVDALQRLYQGQDEKVVLLTGYYDPVEDERNGEVDKYTGWWYVRKE